MLAVSCLLASRAAPAQTLVRCPTIANGSETLARIDPTIRLAWIDLHLARTAHLARTWTWGWGIGIVGATAVNLVPLAIVPPDQRIDWYASSATTIVGLVPLVIAPLDVIDDSRALRARIAAHGPTDDVCVLLADAESKLIRDAQNQADGQRWWLHVGNVVLNAGVGLFLGLGYHHWVAGGVNAAVGAAIGEAIILTQPTSSIGDLAVYRSGALGAPETASLHYRLTF